VSPLFRRRGSDADREAELRAAVDAYLEISRSELRHSEPGWFVLAEEAAWERLSAAAGLAPREVAGRTRTVAVRS
jgi:hypothetical protein